MRVEIEGETYGQGSTAALFDVVEIIVRVWVNEIAANVGP
jgi:hypothetical protein